MLELFALNSELVFVILVLVVCFCFFLSYIVSEDISIKEPKLKPLPIPKENKIPAFYRNN